MNFVECQVVYAIALANEGGVGVSSSISLETGIDATEVDEILRGLQKRGIVYRERGMWFVRG